MFRVDNLVFNKIGNSLSVMVFSNENGLQIWDETDFLFKGVVFSLKGICVDDYLEFKSEIIYKEEKYLVKLFLSEVNSFLQIKDKKYKVYIDNEKILINIEEPELLFKLSMGNFKHISFNEGLLEIKEKNLFKGIVEFFIEIIN